jgi:hypothetical protein
MTDDDIETWIIDLIETNMDEENRKQALDWLNVRAVVYGAVTELGLLTADDLRGLKAKK